MDYVYSDAKQPKPKYVLVYGGISCGCKTTDPNLCVGNWWHQLDKSLEAKRHVIADVVVTFLLMRH